MKNKEEIFKITIDVVNKAKCKSIKICNGYNKFSIYAYGEEIMFYKNGTFYLKINDQVKIGQLLSLSCYKGFIKKDLYIDEVIVLDSSLCYQIHIFKKIIQLAIKEAEIVNLRKQETLKNMPLACPAIKLNKETLLMLEKINIKTLGDFKVLGPLAIVSILLSAKIKPSFNMLLKFESIDKQIPVFLLDEKTIFNLKKFWKKIEQLHEQ